MDLAEAIAGSIEVVTVTYLIADDYIKVRMDKSYSFYKKVLSHIGIESSELSYHIKSQCITMDLYVNEAMFSIEDAERIVDIRTHDDPWDRRNGFESNIEVNYALLIGKTVECMPFHMEDDE